MKSDEVYFEPSKSMLAPVTPCPRCAALETTRRSLRDLLDASEAGDDAGWLCAAQDAASALLAGIPVVGFEEMERERDAKAALLGELAAAANIAADLLKMHASDLMPEARPLAERTAMRIKAVLRRAEAEAGGER